MSGLQDCLYLDLGAWFPFLVTLRIRDIFGTQPDLNLVNWETSGFLSLPF